MITVFLALLSGLMVINLLLTLHNTFRTHKVADKRVEHMMIEENIQEHVAVREEAHDARIMRMKEELANQQNPRNTDSVALELDPNVKNLPHSIIDRHSGRSLTEVSE